MIRVTLGTTYITAEAFCDRYNFAQVGQEFAYATGNLRQASAHDPDARKLREFIADLIERKRIVVERRHTGRKLPDGGPSLEYLAVKRSYAPAIYGDYLQPTRGKRVLVPA